MFGKKWSLGVALPILVLCFFWSYLFIEYNFEMTSTKAQVIERQSMLTDQQIDRFIEQSSLAMEQKQFSRVADELTILTSDINVLVAVLLDKQGVVKHSNHYVWRNNAASEVLDGYQSKTHQKQIEVGSSQLLFNSSRLTLQGYYPLNQHLLNIEQNIELFYIEYDISLALNRAQIEIQQIFINKGIVGTILIVLFFFSLHFMLIRQLRSLVTAEEGQVGNGKLYFSEVDAVAKRITSLHMQLSSCSKKLKESEQRWLYSIDGSASGVWDWSINTGRVFLSDRWKEMLGFMPDELPSSFQSWESRLHPDDKDTILSELNSYLKGEIDSFENVHRLRHKDGHFVWVLDKGSVVQWDEQGNPMRMIGSHTDISDDVSSNRVLNKASISDSLTQLPNRQALIDRMKSLEPKITKTQSGLILLDVDNFKTINEGLGRQLGDEVLMQLARRLQNHFAKRAFLARLSGDEFAILFEGLSAINGTHRTIVFAEEIKKVISHPFIINEQQLHIRVSLGVSMIHGGCEDPISAISQAELAMFQAKEQGRDTFAMYTPELQNKAKLSLWIQNELREALSEDKLQVHFQPIVDNDNQIKTIETLLRWEHPVKGWISPAEFIPVAESSELIVQLGHWVAEKICQYISTLKNNGIIDIPVFAINVSARQFCQNDFKASLMGVLDRYKIEPRQIELELTEYVVLSPGLDSVERLTEFSKEGFSIAIDDFGTGFSSLSYLQQLPIQKLKIDSSFISKIGQGSKPNILVKSIIDLAHNMSLSVVAEGVEYGHQQQWLSANGCDLYQGYLFYRPLAPADMLTLLKTSSISETL
ncbi:bifunctional diguanylate cyclase/phosphodiesterase [Paraferrimonas sp. SM1919]|uniref:putative bifunctional diguanylate cyclase/phosphodiesterase n=1 Tax=Paraferrimonas sp. SM1919 TaxID=2662263 RepID=UPI0013D56E37|nr:GGDEF and EAL domain-containing protein [Paraferrimonas sp. SM1919]